MAVSSSSKRLRSLQTKKRNIIKRARKTMKNRSRQSNEKANVLIGLRNEIAPINDQIAIMNIRSKQGKYTYGMNKINAMLDKLYK